MRRVSLPLPVLPLPWFSFYASIVRIRRLAGPAITHMQRRAFRVAEPACAIYPNAMILIIRTSNAMIMIISTP